MTTDQALQVFYVTLPLVGTILLAMWNNNKRIDDLKTSLEKRVDDLTTSVNTGFADVKVSIGKLDTRISELEKGNETSSELSGCRATLRLQTLVARLVDGRAAKPLGHATQFRKVMSLVGAAWWCEIAKRVPGFARCDREVSPPVSRAERPSQHAPQWWCEIAEGFF